MSSPASALAKLLPPVLLNAELQALVVAGVCFVGVWVIVTKILQLLFTVLWPLLVLGALYAAAPDFTQRILVEVIPEQLQVGVDWARNTLPGLVAQRAGDIFTK